MDKIKTLTVEEVIKMHDEILNDSGGLAGKKISKYGLAKWLKDTPKKH